MYELATNRRAVVRAEKKPLRTMIIGYDHSGKEISAIRR